ncbi:MAG: Smr/MutS family protein [Novosphingobium sp.]|nr:Smr/MutS family protein [Novosphingobium sp.]
MSRGGRGLTPDEEAVWARVASTVTPLATSARKPRPQPVKVAVRPVREPDKPVATVAPAPVHHRPIGAHGLDSGWDRKLAKGQAHPDFTLDLHGCTLDAAHGRLLHGLTQAKALGARVVLLVTGRARPVDPADRMTRRGAIRAKVIDWLAASEHAADIAAIRGAHPRHGGQGALYIVLKRRRS